MYEIKKLELHGLEGLSLAKIETIVIEDIKQFIIVLGRNGCGKSTIMGMMYPIAPPKSMFGVGGYYRNTGIINGHVYEFYIKRVNDNIKCYITNKTTGVKVCDAVNGKVYNAYVEELTKLTPSIVKLITGKELFTDMSSLTRKFWLDKFSSNDMTYALSFFQRLKESHRDTVGVMKHLSKALSDVTKSSEDEESERITTNEKLDDVSKKIKLIDEELNQNPSFSNYMQVTEEELFSYFEKTSSLINDSKIPDYLKDDFDLVKLNTRLDGIHTTLGQVQESHSNASRKLTELDNELQRHEYYLNNRQPLQERLDSLNNLLKEAKDEILVYPTILNEDIRYLSAAVSEINNNFTRIDSICDVIKSGQTRKGVISEHEKQKELLTDLENGISRYERTLNDTQALLDHYNHTEETACPKCEWRFKPGVTHTNKATLESDIKKCNEYIVRLKNDLEEQTRVFGEICVQLNAFNELNDWMISNLKTPVVCELIKRIISDRVVQDKPKQMHLYLANAKDEVSAGLRYNKLLKEVEIVKGTLDTLNKTESVNIESMLVEKDKVVKDLEDYQTHLSKLRSEVEIVKSKIQTVQRIRNNIAARDSELEKADGVLEGYITSTLFSKLTEQRLLLSDQWISLREKAIKLEETVKYREIVTKQHEEQRNKQKMLSELIEAMSPEKGLLREYYYNSVVKIVDLMNGYLSDVWTYPLVVQPCPIVNEQLSYSFPFVYGEDEKLVGDVSEGSDAQKQIFNLVFRLAAFRALGLVGFPLLLDEPGTGFDEQHRVVFIDFIKTLIEEGEFTQLFLISHYSDVHSRLSRADFVVLDPEGLTLPLTYNENVKLSHYEI